MTHFTAEEIQEIKIKQAQDALDKLFPARKRGIIWEEEEIILTEKEKEVKEEKNG
jgi:hypothetical protein